MALGSIFGDIAGGIGRGVLALGTGGISEMYRNQDQQLGQALATSQTPGEAISKLGQIGTPAAVELASKIMSNQPAFNPLTPKDVAAYGAQMYAANPLMNSPPDLGALAQGQMPATNTQQNQQMMPQGGAPSGGQMPVNPRQLQGQDWLNYLQNRISPGFAASVKAIAEGREAPPPPSSRSAQAQLLMQAVAQYDPNFDFANAAQNFKNRQSTETEFTKGDAAKNLRSIGTASNHLAHLVSQIPGTANHDFTPLNAVQNYVADKMGASGITKFNQTADALAGELGAVYKGSGHNSDTEISTMRKSLDPNASPEQKFGALENALSLMQGRAEELAQQYNRGKNVEPGDPQYKKAEDFLSPEAKANIAEAKQAIYDFKTKGQIPTNLGTQQQPAALQAPAVGTVVKGYKFLGGNPADQKSWAKQ